MHHGLCVATLHATTPISSQPIEHALPNIVRRFWGQRSRCERTEPAIPRTLLINRRYLVLYTFRDDLEELLGVLVFARVEEGVGTALGLGA